MVSWPLVGEKIQPLTELINPQEIAVDDQNIYIVQRAKVYIYSKTDNKLKRVFGKRGEGPREFIPVGDHRKINLFLLPDQILINSLNKVSYFSKDGSFVRETKAQPGLGFLFKPVNNHYVGYSHTDYDRILHDLISLYDTSLRKKTKVIHKERHFFQRGRSINPLKINNPLFRVFNNEIFISTDNGAIKIFNPKGDLLNKITFSYQKVPLDHKRRQKYISFFTSSPIHKDFYHRDRKYIKYPDYFPLIRDFKVIDNRIYIVTYREQKQNREMLISTTSGKLIKKSFVPVVEASPLNLFPFTIKDGKIYQLIENTSTENWELHIIEVLGQ
jgi:hypothetical protein